MIPILICDDDKYWLDSISKEIEIYQMKSDWELKILCRASSPKELLDCIRREKPLLGIYFLDIDLKSSINGLELGRRIREADPHANLVFVTVHYEKVFLSLEMSFGICNYILKHNPFWRKQLQQTLQYIEDFYHIWEEKASPSITIQYGSFRESIAKKDIYYIESVKNTHRIQISLKNGEQDCPGSLSQLEKQLGDGFLLCRRDCLVNLSHVQSFDKGKRLLLLDNGAAVDCSVRKCGKIAEWLS